MVESLSCYGFYYKREQQRKLLALEMNYLRSQLDCRDYEKLQTALLGAKCKQKNFRETSKN